MRWFGWFRKPVDPIVADLRDKPYETPGVTKQELHKIVDELQEDSKKMVKDAKSMIDEAMPPGEIHRMTGTARKTPDPARGLRAEPTHHEKTAAPFDDRFQEVPDKAAREVFVPGRKMVEETTRRELQSTLVDYIRVRSIGFLDGREQNTDFIHGMRYAADMIAHWPNDLPRTR